MDISNMNLAEVEERLSHLEVEVRDMTDVADVEKATEEKRALLERKAELKDLEERKAQAQALNNGVVTPDNIIERKEENKMEKRTFAVDTVEYREAWLKRLQGKELDAEERAAVTATSAIPTETMNQIVGKLDLVPIIAAVDMTYIPGNVTYPVENSVGAASWLPVGTASTDSSDALTSISLAAYKLIKTVEITADVAAMAIGAFETWLVSRLANKLQFAIDAAIIAGDGTNKATGILTTISATGTYAKTGMTYKNLMSIIAALKTQYLHGATFVMPRATFFGEVLGMEDSQGNKVVVADAQSPAKFNILGFPVIIDDNCTADTVIFGDLKEYKFNFAKAPEVTSDASVEFRSGSIVYRAYCLADGKVADQNAFVVYNKAV